MNPKLGTRVMKKASILFIAWLFAANTVFAEAPAITGIVAVGTTAEAAPGRTGFVADDNGYIIARIKVPNQTLSVSTVDGAQYSAHTVAYDKASGLVLLKVDEGADTLKPYIFAHHPAEPQRKVYGIKAQVPVAQSSVVGGTLSAVQPSNGKPPDYYLHNALVGDTGMGGPLFNNCGEVVGVVVPPPKFLTRVLIREKEGTAYAVPIEWLVSQFATRGVRPARAASPCLSEAEQLAAAEQKTTVTQSKLEEETRRAATTAQAAVDAQTELDAVKRQLDEAQDAGEDERLRLEAEIQARQGKLDEARTLETTARDALATAQRAVDEARAREASVRDALEAAQRAGDEARDALEVAQRAAQERGETVSDMGYRRGRGVAVAFASGMGNEAARGNRRQISRRKSASRSGCPRTRGCAHSATRRRYSSKGRISPGKEWHCASPVLRSRQEAELLWAAIRRTVILSSITRKFRASNFACSPPGVC